MEGQGQTFYITGKESVINVLRDTYSVRTLMEDGQLQLLIKHVGDFANNYTADTFKTGIIKRHSKSALLAGMTLQLTTDHDLETGCSL
jgi:DNA polymerase III delta subunit